MRRTDDAESKVTRVLTLLPGQSLAMQGSEEVHRNFLALMVQFNPRVSACVSTDAPSLSDESALESELVG